jgi:hypothetical protein
VEHRNPVRTRILRSSQRPASPGHRFQETRMSISISQLTPIVALVAGVLILVMPRLLNYIVAFYLIIIGAVGLFGK